MQRIQSNRATFEVANNRGISGRAAADEINRSLRTGKKRSFWHIASSTFLWSLSVGAFVFALAPISTHAAPGGVPAEIAELKAQVAALQSQVQALQTQLAAIQSNNALKLGPFVTVDPNPENGVIGPNITFKGANIHIVSGSVATDDHGTRSGLCNLIIGYD